MKLLLVSVFFIIVFDSFSQTLSKEQIVEDLNYLLHNIKKYNPALDTYNPIFDVQCEELISTVNDSVSLLKYFSYVSQICAYSNEGHFKLGEWSDEIHKGFINNTYNYLPFSVKIISNKIFLWNIFTSKVEFEQGDEILSINGIQSNQILKQLYQFIPSDGNIITNLEKKASAGFAWMYFIYIEQPDFFQIEYKSYKTKEVKIIKLKSINRLQQVENYKKLTINDSIEKPLASINDFYELKFIKDYCYLNLKSFDYKLVNKYNLNAKKLYNQIFKSIKDKNTKNLIIDLRNNTGGVNKFADEIVPFILQNHQGQFLKKSLSWSGKTKKYKFPKKNKIVYEGKIYVLVNGLTYSAGASLARYLKEYGNTIVIGEETGSRYEGFAAGSTQFVNIPNSTIKIGIPRYHTIFPVSKKQKTINRGLIPDIEIKNTISDMIQNNDSVLDYVISIIKK